MKDNLNNKMLIIFLALLMFILIPTSFATDINNIVVNEVAIDNVQTGEIQTSVEDVNYGGVIGVDNHTDKQGYIEFNNDHITVKEGQSATIVGTLYMYEEDGEGYE